MSHTGRRAIAAFAGAHMAFTHLPLSHALLGRSFVRFTDKASREPTLEVVSHDSFRRPCRRPSASAA